MIDDGKYTSDLSPNPVVQTNVPCRVEQDETFNSLQCSVRTITAW